MFKAPRSLGEVIEIIDELSKWYGKEGHKQASRIDNGESQVLVYFPVMKTKGELVQLNWNQCRRKL